MASGVPVLELVASSRVGGGAQHVHTLARALRIRGFTPVVAGPAGGPLLAALESEGIDTVEMATDGLGAWTLLRVARLVTVRRIRLVHSHGKGPGIHGRLAARLRGIPAVHTFHGIHFEHYPAPARRLYLGLERALGRITTTVVSVSRAEQAEALALGLVRPARSRVIPNGVDVARLDAEALDRQAARAALGIAAGARVVGTVARFDPVKGVDLLLRAVAAVPEAGIELVLIGEGAEGERLRALAGALGLGRRVRFTGELTGAARYLRAFDLFASGARKEGLPLAVLEAMALGLPVVATDIAAHREVLGEGTESLAAPEAPALGAALARLVENGAGAALGAANRERVRVCFGVDRMVEALVETYRAALDGGAP